MAERINTEAFHEKVLESGKARYCGLLFRQLCALQKAFTHAQQGGKGLRGTDKGCQDKCAL